MTRFTTICAVLFGLLASATTADEASREATMKAFEMLVGHWEVVQPNGNTGKFTVKKSESGCYVMSSSQTTLVIGWDRKDKIVKATGFTPNGAIVHTWKHVGDGQSWREKPTTERRCPSSLPARTVTNSSWVM